MPNDYFKFKQFVVEQDNCVQKVGTDGVLLGAWVGASNCKYALDIGSGTGLIALMLAQKLVQKIIAVEIDKSAYRQSKQNVDNSIFASQITLINADIQTYAASSNVKFDLIVSNPPFFQHHLKSLNKKKNIARHSQTLNFLDLIEAVVKLLDYNGKFCVVIPYDEKNTFLEMCYNKELFLNRILNVKPTPEKQIKRVLLELSFNKKDFIEDILIVEENGRHQYSKKYKELTKDFYLKF